MNFARPWNEFTFIGFDLETTGKYPIESEICEIAAIKWTRGGLGESFQSLVKPSRPMSDEVIKIHGITNEMVASAPTIEEVLPRFRQFIEGGILIAHHAPFDMGFLSVDFERLKIQFPQEPVLCSSLLARKIFPESPNHRLQTLIQFLKLPQGQAHRALDDCTACLQVALNVFEKIGVDKTLADVFSVQSEKLSWQLYQLSDLRRLENLATVFQGLDANTSAMIRYQGGSNPGKAREITPKGIIRNPNGDFVVAICGRDHTLKRFYVNKILPP